MTYKLTALSLGAGVQSTTLYLMALAGEFKYPPSVALFADTGWEPRAVYQHLEWLKTLSSKIPIITVSKGSLIEDTKANVANSKRFASLPFFSETRALNSRANETTKGMLKRQCTPDYKIFPITKKLRELMGYKPRQRIKEKCCLWIGISKDEASRMKPNRERWIDNTWPLIDRLMSRSDCKKWMKEHGYSEPPKSSCIGCPYHDDALWREMKTKYNDEFQAAVEFERLVHNKLKNVRGELYLHRSLRFLDEIDFRNAEDLGQLNLFENECDGYCGT